MPKTLTGNNPLRLKYEEVYGKIRHSQWLNVRSEIVNAGLTLDSATITFYAQFKKLQPRKVLTRKTLQKLNDFAYTHQGIKNSFSGAELETLILKNTTLPQYALYRCFYKAKVNFCKEKLYTFDEAYRVLTFAYTFTNATATKERHYANSTK